MSYASLIPTKRLSRQIVTENPRVRVCEDRVQFHTGREAVHWKVEYLRQGVGIIPLLDDGRVILGLHYRYCAGEWGWEIAAGSIEHDEGQADAGRRELEEETGYRAGNLEHVLTYYPAPGLGDETFHVYLATGLTKSSRPYDNEEIYELRAVTWGQIENMIATRKIIDGLTLTALLYARARGMIGHT